jgi:hypothetical protein
LRNYSTNVRSGQAPHGIESWAFYGQFAALQEFVQNKLCLA